MSHTNLAAAALLLSLLGGAGAGCAADAETQSDAASSSPESRTDLSLKPAVAEPIVKFAGLVNDGEPVSVDLASFDALPQQTLTTFEPFVKKDITFTGVGFADLLDAAAASGSSVTVHALDDYVRTMDAAVLREPGVLLATRQAGELIPIAEGGPVRLVFPDGSEAGADSDLWVWSVDLITVR